MDQNTTGGAAFPRPASSIDRESFRPQSGLTTRDYFAAKAMPALIHAFLTNARQFDDEDVARTAYMVADAMLKARAA